MKRVLITGMSGTGKSSVIRELAARGYKALDTDWNPDWEEPHSASDGPGWLWREDRIDRLLSEEDAGALFIGACVENQGKFYKRFDHIVVLTASPELTVERLAKRSSTAYGKRPEEVREVLHFKKTVEPLLLRSASLRIDTSKPLADVVAEVAALAGFVA